MVAIEISSRDAENGRGLKFAHVQLAQTCVVPSPLNSPASAPALYQSLGPVPSFYEVVLESLDGHATDLLVNATVHRDNELISIAIENVLPPKSLWNTSILTYGCESDDTVTELSKLGHYNSCKSSYHSILSCVY